MIDYKFNEKNTIEQIKRYVDNTYKQHYASGKQQAIIHYAIIAIHLWTEEKTNGK